MLCFQLIHSQAANHVLQTYIWKMDGASKNLL